MPKPIISADYRNDHYTQWVFARDSKIPRGYFTPRQLDPDRVVWIATCIIAVVMVGLWAAGKL